MPDDDQDEESSFGTPTKAALGIALVVASASVAFLVWFAAFRDTWEIENGYKLIAQVDRAVQAKKTDPLQAYKLADEVIKTANGHAIEDTALQMKLDEAKQVKAALHEVVTAQLQAEEQERLKKAQEENERVRAEQQRVAETQRRLAEEDKARKVAVENERKLAEALERELSKYQTIPKPARDALNVLRKLEARTEIGINFRDFSSEVGTAWGEIKVFADSPEGAELKLFCALIVSAMSKYKLSLDIWQSKIDRGKDDFWSDYLFKECWRSASTRIYYANSIVRDENRLAALKRALLLAKTDAEYEVKVNALMQNIKRSPEVRNDYSKQLAELTAIDLPAK